MGLEDRQSAAYTKKEALKQIHKLDVSGLDANFSEFSTAWEDLDHAAYSIMVDIEEEITKMCQLYQIDENELLDLEDQLADY